MVNAWTQTMRTRLCTYRRRPIALQVGGPDTQTPADAFGQRPIALQFGGPDTQTPADALTGFKTNQVESGRGGPGAPART
jgi:hypothetical protein